MGLIAAPKTHQEMFLSQVTGTCTMYISATYTLVKYDDR